MADEEAGPVIYVYYCCDHCDGCAPHEWHMKPCPEGCNDARP